MESAISLPGPKEVGQRKERIKNWLSDPYNLAILGIFIMALAIRLYYFFLTKSQPLWWDEADYMAYAKNLAGLGSHWVVTSAHQSIFPYLVAALFKIGFSEIMVRFFVSFLPSIIIVFLTYKIVILMYEDKNIALLSTLLIATFWELLFNSFRFHLEGPALLFGFLSIYIFFKGYEKKEKIFGKIDQKWAIPLTVFFVLLTYAFRRSYFWFGFFFLFYMIFTKEFKDLAKDKYNWIALLLFVALFLFLETLVFPVSVVSVSTQYYTEYPLSLLPFKVFNAYFENIFNQSLSILYYLFWFGFILVVSNLAIHLGYFKKSADNKFKSDLFAFLMMAVVLSYFLFYQKRPPGDFGEPRWYYPLLLGSLICISRGTLFITNYIKRYSKIISIIVLVALIGYGEFYELKHADMIIKDKIPSFEGIKQAALFVENISSPEDIAISVPEPQPAYYSRRLFVNPVRLSNKSIPPPPNNFSLEEFLSVVKKNESIKFIIVTFSEPNHPSWMKKEIYSVNPQTGQSVFAGWQIPFMKTTIDLIKNQQEIKQEASYGKITFKLLTIKQETFIYQIVRNNQTQ